MTESVANIDRKTKPGELLKLAALQLVGTVVFSLSMYYCFDQREAISASLGGAIACFSTLFLASRLFTARENMLAEEILARFYITTVLKIIFTLAFMAFCIIVLKVAMLPFIVAYLLAALIVNWLFLLFYKWKMFLYIERLRRNEI